MKTRNALQGMIDGSRLGKREQTVLTPAWLTDLIVKDWGENIVLDPCAEPEACNVPAEIHLTVDGTLVDWVDRTYVNPPFDDLRKWLEHAAWQATLNDKRIAVLAPARAHRWWYRRARYAAAGLVQFNPFPFVDHKNVFPAPLELLCFGWVPDPQLWHPHGVQQKLSYYPGAKS